MENPSSRKKDWTLTQEAFNLLLTRLDSNKERAAQKYEQIRKALIAYFEFHGCLSPAEQTDDTFNRVARNLLDGKDIYIDNPAGYFYGVARNVLRQYRSEKSKKSLSLEDLPENYMRQGYYELFNRVQERKEHERRLDCLEKCLAALSEQNKELIVRYYDGQTRVKIDNRKRMAERLGITINLLRVRAKRVREQLEVCVEQCLGQN